MIKLIFSLSWAGLRANITRSLMSLCGIALGVALGVAVQAINNSALTEMSQATRTLSGAADVTARGGTAGFNDLLFATVANHADVAVASPIVEQQVRTPKAPRSFKLIGADYLLLAQLNPAIALRLNDTNNRFSFFESDHVFINDAAKQALTINNLVPEDALFIDVSSTSNTAVKLKIAGSIEWPSITEPLIFQDIAAAQQNFSSLNTISRIDIRLNAGVNRDAFIAKLKPKLPDNVALLSPEAQDDQAAAVSRAYRVNLTALSLIALFTGGFLVFTTQALAVVRRQAELALLRTLGFTQNQLIASLTLEGALIGAAGAAIGIGVGLGIAQVVMQLLGGDLGSGFFAGSKPNLSLSGFSIVVFGLLGLFTGAAGAFVPARVACAMPPARGLKPGAAELMFTTLPSPIVGFGLLLAGGALTQTPALLGLPLLAYAGIALILFGAIALTPHLCKLIIPSKRPKIGRLEASSKSFLALDLSLAQMRNAPGQTAIGMAGVVTSFSLMVAMLVMISSFRQSLDVWLNKVLLAPAYVRVSNGFTELPGTFTAAQQARIAADSAVERVEFNRFRNVLVSHNGAQADLAIIARNLTPEVIKSLTPVNRVVQANSTLPETWISESTASLLKVQAGDNLRIQLNADTPTTFYVAGLWRDYSRTKGAAVIDRTVYQQISGDALGNDAAVWFKPGWTFATARDHWRKTWSAGDWVDVNRLAYIDATEIRSMSLKIFDRSFAATYLLQAAAILVGLAGISATFSALAWARRREFGMLRHLGMAQSEISAMLSIEGALVGLIGAATGLVTGFVISLVLIFVVNRQSFHWSMELHTPWLICIGLGVLLIALASIAARFSGQAAMSQAPVQAVKADA